MLKFRISIRVLVVLLLVTVPVISRAEVDLGGYLEIDKRFKVSKGGIPMEAMYNTLRLELNAAPSENIEAFLSGEIRYYDFSIPDDMAGLSDTDSLSPLDLLLWESYIDIYDVGLRGLDWRLGKQRINWGTADRLNPTDNLNPDDFTDFLDFGEKVPSLASRFSYNLFDDFTLSYIWLPTLVPAYLPRFARMPFGQEDDLPMPPGMTVKEMETTEKLDTPEYDLKHSMHAVRLSGSLIGVDLSLSYFRGYDDLPLAKEVTITAVDVDNVNIYTRMGFPQIQVTGADLAGELFTIGYWAEVAIFYPEEVKMNLTVPTGPTTSYTTQEEVLSDSSYTKYTIGLDYTFNWGTYVNLQYNHGFFTERGKDELNDYVFLRAEHKFLNDKVKLGLGGALETHRFEDIKDNNGTAIFPEVSLKPWDNFDLTIGMFILDGKGDSLFQAMKDEDQIYTRIKVTF